jgi:hypothetical protein
LSFLLLLLACSPSDGGSDGDDSGSNGDDSGTPPDDSGDDDTGTLPPPIVLGNVTIVPSGPGGV